MARLPEKRPRHKPVKPIPPPDIWEQLAALQEQPHVPERPANSVTAEEYGAKFGHTDSWGHRRLRDLVAQGKLKTVRWGRQNVYVLVAPLP